MRCLMFGAGVNPFATGWAKAAATACDVVGISSLDDGFAPIAALNRVGTARKHGITVLGVDQRPRLHPTRIMWPLNDRMAARRTGSAVDWLVKESGNLDIVHSHFYAGAGLAARVADRLAVPFVHTEHSSNLLPNSEYTTVSRAGLAQARYIYKRAARVLFVSTDLLEAALGLGLRAVVVGRSCSHTAEDPCDFIPVSSDEENRYDHCKKNHSWDPWPCWGTLVRGDPGRHLGDGRRAASD